MTIDFVRRLPIEDVEAIYSRQPTLSDVARDPRLTRHDLPRGHVRPPLDPGSSRLESSTLLRRDFIHGEWDEDDEGYYLVVTHNQSPWGDRYRRDYGSQSYSLVVQIVDEERTDLDLHALVEAELQAVLRQELRAHV
jgi:hypothetical protein